MDLLKIIHYAMIAIHLEEDIFDKEGHYDNG